MHQLLRRKTVLLLLILSLTTLACRFTLELPWNVPVQDVEISPDDVAAAATRAAVAAATAASVADQAAQLAATAVLQGDDIVSTVVAGEDLSSLGAAAGALQQKLSSITPDANGNFTITVTDADLAQYLAAQGGAFSNAEASIENVQVSLLPQHILVTGDLTQPVALPINAELRPVVENGRLRFQVISATAGIFPVPDSLLSTLEAGVDAGLGRAFDKLPAGVSMVDVALGDGSMTFLVHQE